MNVRTLIVDDQADIRLLLRIMIQSANHGLTVRGEAEGGEDALAILEAVDPDVVVIDQMMPGMTGIQTGLAIRARRPEQKMIMCTAFLNDGVRAEAEEAGFAACVGKDRITDIPDLLRSVAMT